MLDLNFDEIDNKKVKITELTNFFAWTHDFDWTAFIYVNDFELVVKFLAYFSGKKVKLIYSNDEQEYQ